MRTIVRAYDNRHYVRTAVAHDSSQRMRTLGLTRAQLAERIGTDQTFVSKYETGERRLDVLEVREVCRAMGISFIAFARRLESELK